MLIQMKRPVCVLIVDSLRHEQTNRRNLFDKNYVLATNFEMRMRKTTSEHVRLFRMIGKRRRFAIDPAVLEYDQ